MVTAAIPEPEVMTKLVAVCARKKPMLWTAAGRAFTAMATVLEMVSMIMASSRTIIMPLAKPTVSALPASPLAPVVKVVAILLGDSPARNPQITPMTRKRAAISSKYH